MGWWWSTIRLVCLRRYFGWSGQLLQCPGPSYGWCHLHKNSQTFYSACNVDHLVCLMVFGIVRAGNSKSGLRRPTRFSLCGENLPFIVRAATSTTDSISAKPPLFCVQSLSAIFPRLLELRATINVTGDYTVIGLYRASTWWYRVRWNTYNTVYSRASHLWSSVIFQHHCVLVIADSIEQYSDNERRRAHGDDIWWSLTPVARMSHDRRQVIRPTLPAAHVRLQFRATLLFSCFISVFSQTLQATCQEQ